MREPLARALERRKALLGRPLLRLFHEEGVPGLFIDRYGPGAVLILRREMDAAAVGEALLDLVPGLRAVYAQPRGRSDRASLVAGEPLPMPLVVEENGLRFEVRLDEGFSTGLFLDQRENRRALMQGARGIRVLNAFAHTCAFGVALAAAGASTTNVDVSRRYLEWGKRNYALNGLDLPAQRFHAMDAFRYFGWAARKGLRFDLLVLDPPTFSAGTKRLGIPPFSAERDYTRLVRAAVPLLAPEGRLFCATNAAALCRRGALRDRIRRALARAPEWLPLPGAPPDFRGGGEPVSAAALLRPSAGT